VGNFVGNFVESLAEFNPLPQTHIASTKSFDRLRTNSRRRNETLTTRLNTYNANGVAPRSPGLRRQALPWVACSKSSPTPNGRMGLRLIHGSVRRNPFSLQGSQLNGLADP